MGSLRVVISPLSWGLGHAGRMIPLALEMQRRGWEVIFAADEPLLKMVSRELSGERPSEEELSEEELSEERLSVKNLSANQLADMVPAKKELLDGKLSGNESNESPIPTIRMVTVPGLRIRYSRYLPQYLFIFLQLPRIIWASVAEQRQLKRLVDATAPDVIISDNRFGFFHKKVFSVYVTHQLRIPFPRALRFLERPVSSLHRMVINRYDLCLVPDYPGENNLSGRLSHTYSGKRSHTLAGTLPGASTSRQAEKGRQPEKKRRQRGTRLFFMGPLSRFAGSSDSTSGSSDSTSGSSNTTADSGCHDHSDSFGSVVTACGVTLTPPYICLVLSGPEPQRSLLSERVVSALHQTLTGNPHLRLVILTATEPPYRSAGTSPAAAARYLIAPDIDLMRQLICHASLVITRAGYTMIMELVSLGRGAVLVPTPGQPEQEYLGGWLDGRYGFITMEQNRLHRLAPLAKAIISNNSTITETGNVINSSGSADGRAGGSADLRDESAGDCADHGADSSADHSYGSIYADRQSSHLLPDSAPLLEEALKIIKGEVVRRRKG